jgi:PPK2 family polyphosphate:nucleotide phosphotransferase
MDTAGKGGIVKHVVGAANPQGIRYTGFGVPTEEERKHNYLWRIRRALPPAGHIGVFDRSHYEDVLVVRVHRLVPEDVWSKRYALINDFEHLLRAEAGTTVVKFFLHISKEEQLRRFEQRLEDPERQWKIAESDYTERDRWDEYVEAYEDVLSETSTKHAPWYVVPADKKWVRNLMVAQVLVDTLQGMDIQPPEPAVDLHRIRAAFHRAAGKPRSKGKGKVKRKS